MLVEQVTGAFLRQMHFLAHNRYFELIL